MEKLITVCIRSNLALQGEGKGHVTMMVGSRGGEEYGTTPL